MYNFRHVGHRDIQKIVEGEPQQLIETVAEAVAYTILRQHPRVQTAVVRVDKPEAPIDGTFGTVGTILFPCLFIDLDQIWCADCVEEAEGLMAH
jgi:dihydroneopterin aldolase